MPITTKPQTFLWFPRPCIVRLGCFTHAYSLAFITVRMDFVYSHSKFYRLIWFTYFLWDISFLLLLLSPLVVVVVVVVLWQLLWLEKCRLCCCCCAVVSAFSCAFHVTNRQVNLQQFEKWQAINEPRMNHTAVQIIRNRISAFTEYCARQY